MAEKKWYSDGSIFFATKNISANGPFVQLPSLELSEGLLIDLFTRLVILVRLAVPGMSESNS